MSYLLSTTFCQRLDITENWIISSSKQFVSVHDITMKIAQFDIWTAVVGETIRLPWHLCITSFMCVCACVSVWWWGWRTACQFQYAFSYCWWSCAMNCTQFCAKFDKEHAFGWGAGGGKSLKYFTFFNHLHSCHNEYWWVSSYSYAVDTRFSMHSK